MSQAEELLNSLDNDMTITPNSDDDYIVVNQDRTISVPDSLRRLGVQHDHNIETVTFNCPRFWDGNDMSQMKIYINYMRPDGVKGRYLTGNLEVADDTMTFDWTISNNVTHVRGTLSFLICIVQTDEDGIEVQHWNSELNQECYISEGMECTESIVLGYPDVITHLLLQMEKMGPGGGRKYPDWSHLTWYVMGDSLTAPGHEHTEKYYYEFIQEKTGINIIVDGIGGTGYRAGYSDNENSFLGRVQRAFPENDKTKNSNVDIVTIFGSGNDIRFVSDSKERKAAIFGTLAHLANHRPGLRVIVVPPSPWMSERDSDYNVITNYDKRGELWKPYCDDLQLCALACDFRYLSDMYDCPPFNPNFSGHLQEFFANRPDGKEADGIHPSTNGHKALAPYFYNALLQELSLKV